MAYVYVLSVAGTGEPVAIYPAALAAYRAAIDRNIQSLAFTVELDALAEADEALRRAFRGRADFEQALPPHTTRLDELTAALRRTAKTDEAHSPEAFAAFHETVFCALLVLAEKVDTPYPGNVHLLDKKHIHL